jgi:pimeloyl-ACP methyl ester carboxylesterase
MKAVRLPDDGAFIRYQEVPGDDPPLIWLHGWQCASTGELMPAAVREPLRGRRSLLVDLLGHGYSDKPVGFGYELEDHARTVVSLIDALGLDECGLVGHSMGGAIAILVAAARPKVVSLLVLAEANVGPEGDDGLDGQTEDQFVKVGFPALVRAQAAEAAAAPEGIRAVHAEMTRLIEPRAIYREAVSMETETDPTIRSLLAGLEIPRWYLMGELSGPEPEFEREMADMGVGWKVIPDAGHPMALQNPDGVAQAIADVLPQRWSG